MEVGEGQALDEGHGGGVVGFGFAGEAGDDVGADGGVGKMVVDETDAAGVVFGAIPAVHGGEDAVGAGLQGHVEVLGDAPRGCKERNQILRDVERFDRADAEPLDWRLVENAAEEIVEFNARRKVAAVGA